MKDYKKIYQEKKGKIPLNPFYQEEDKPCLEDYNTAIEALENITFYTRNQLIVPGHNPNKVIAKELIYKILSEKYHGCVITRITKWRSDTQLHYRNEFNNRIEYDYHFKRQWERFIKEFYVLKGCDLFGESAVSNWDERSACNDIKHSD